MFPFGAVSDANEVCGMLIPMCDGKDKGKLGGGNVPGDEASIYGMPLQWVEFGLCRDVYPIDRLHSLNDVFTRCGISYHLSEFMLMDVILNRRLLQREGVVDHLPPPLCTIPMMW